MGGHDAFVDDADIDRGAADVAGCPRLARLTAVQVGRRGGVAVHAPERAVQVIRIAGRGLMLINPVRFGELYGLVVREVARGGGDSETRGNAQQL